MSFELAGVELLIQTLDREGSFDPPAGELSLAFISKQEIARLHDEFMGDPTPTDVITFPGELDFGQAGEICVCPEVAQEYAMKEGLDFSTELSLYIIHGYLHLCGFDDIADADRADMREAERKALRLIEKQSALPRFKMG